MQKNSELFVRIFNLQWEVNFNKDFSMDKKDLKRTLTTFSDVYFFVRTEFYKIYPFLFGLTQYFILKL